MHSLGFGVAAGEAQDALSGVFDDAPDGAEHERTAGYGFARTGGFGAPYEGCPPVVDEGDGSCGDSAAEEVAGDEASPAPLVLEFVERILAISSLPVAVGEGARFPVEVGDEDDVFPFGFGGDFDEDGCGGFSGFSGQGFGGGGWSICLPPEDDDSAFGAPSF